MSGPKIEELPDDSGSDSDDAPPPLEDMSESIRFKKKFEPKLKKEDPVKAAAVAAAAAAAAAIGKFTKSTVVELHGLSNAKFNGKQGTVTGYIQETERHTVQLQGTGKTIKVKPGNLKRLESFSGFGKGFMAGSKGDGSGGGGKRGATASGADDGIEYVKAKDPEAKTGIFSEVQEAMQQAAPFLEQNKEQWCNDDLTAKLAKNPEMFKMMQNPMFMGALAEFQKNPGEAMQKYGSNPQVSEFFRQFCGVMGEHLSEIGDKEEAAKPKTGGAAQQAQQQIAPAISPGDQAKLDAALAKPEVQAALQDPRIQRMIEDLKLRPEMAPQITGDVMRDPELMRKVQTLVQNGILGTAR